MENPINEISKKPKRSFFKWLVILFLGFTGIITLLIMFLVWKFTPLIKMDDQTNKIQLFGGAIEIDDFGGNFTFNSSYNLKTSKGNRDLSFLTSKKISIISDQLDINIKSHDESSIIYDCTHQGQDLITIKDIMIFNFSETQTSKCSMSVPKGYFLDIKAKGITIILEDFKSNLDLKADIGNFIIKPGMDNEYHYEIVVENGDIKDLINSNNSTAYKIKVNFKNGSVLAQ